MPIKKNLFALLIICISIQAKADEGMWLPQLLSKLNESRMKSLGMKISAKDIYSINSGSLKDAIISFGGFCTGEIISSKGLLLTNHHCGFDAIQNHSSITNNYLKDGFWAKDLKAELPNKGLFATFIIRIDDVSSEIMKGVKSNMTEKERQLQIDKNIEETKKKVKKESYQDCFIRGFFEGNQYYLFVTETYKDVRLVGAPPSSIGNFGKDTDNWVWPRHTGDFSMFRIYADKNNKPAEYSTENIPYTPKRSLRISLSGVKENDFTMVFGFPGRTNEYLHSAAVTQIMTLNDPVKISIREKALKIMDGYMRKDEQIKIQYASKYASMQNAYKKWQGEVLGLNRTGAVDKKIMYEKKFQNEVEKDSALNLKYGTLLSQLSTQYNEYKPFSVARDYYNEVFSKIELFALATQLNNLVAAYNKDGEKGYNEKLPQVQKSINEVLHEYNVSVDSNLFYGLMDLYSRQEKLYVSPLFLKMVDSLNGLTNLTDALFRNNSLTDSVKIATLLSGTPREVIEKIIKSDASILLKDIQKTYQNNVQTKLTDIQNNINRLQRTYMQAQMEVMKNKQFYPDANSTLRVTYGNVKGYTARDAVQYNFYTYLDGVIEKYKPGDYEFDVPEKLRDLYARKDYGRYGMEGKMPVCFIATNHTTGGNSGSPALDANGNLIGLNFDRVWEGTMSDINYDASICRNIMVDIRYVLFIVDKFAGAVRLIDEMKLVHTSKK